MGTMQTMTTKAGKAIQVLSFDECLQLVSGKTFYSATELNAVLKADARSRDAYAPYVSLARAVEWGVIVAQTRTQERRAKRTLAPEQVTALRALKATLEWPGVAAAAKQFGVRKSKVCDAVRGVLTPGRYHYTDLRAIKAGTIKLDKQGRQVID